MTRLALVALPGNEAATARLADELPADAIVPETRHFPDGETYLRVDADVRGRETAIVCTLDRPDAKTVPLLFLARLLRDLGAARVGFIAPYLAYMRQDRRFRNGEAVTSQYFANLLCSNIDWLVTIDPHLHRRGALSEIYTIPATRVTCAPIVANYLRAHIDRPALVGPDSESEQWVSAIAADAGAPFVVLEKERRGDRDVRVSVPNPEKLRAHTPVLIDDIIATGHTMIETVKHLRAVGLPAPVCLGIHAVFAGRAYDDLRDAGAAQIVTTNTIPHESNAIDVTSLLAGAIHDVLRAR